MSDLCVSVRKLTDVDLMREACESTFLGKSNLALLDMYKSEHSPARTQIFWVTLKNVKLFIATHLLRHHVGSVPFQLTCREDRNGGNPRLVDRCNAIISNLSSTIYKQQDEQERQDVIVSSIESLEWLKENADRNTPVNLSLLVNAQALIDMAKLRLCLQANKETISVFKQIKSEIKKVDSSLASMMVRKCVYRGGICGEPRCCGFNSTEQFIEEMEEYVGNFSYRQLGMLECYSNKDVK